MRGRDANLTTLCAADHQTGRLLLTERDRACSRSSTAALREPYASPLPADWLAGREPAELVGDPAQVARELFARG